MLKIFKLVKNNDKESIKECLRLLGLNDFMDKESEIILNEISMYIFNTNEKHSTEKKTFDLNLDFKYYFNDFLKLGINLLKDDISWLEFDYILEGIFLDEKSITNKMLEYRLYEKPSKNQKVNEDKEHKFRMKMKHKYALSIVSGNNSSDAGLGKLWNYLEHKIGGGKEE